MTSDVVQVGEDLIHQVEIDLPQPQRIDAPGLGHACRDKPGLLRLRRRLRQLCE